MWLWVTAGAAAGASLRLALSLWLHTPVYGNLAANWLGCFLAGLVLAVSWHTALPDAVKYGLSVGFLGSLTTFSAFSAEWVGALLNGRWAAAGAVFLLHTAGGALWTLLGVGAVYGLKRFIVD
ncbi:MAG: CrcB family protein [Conchiformibius sp.]|nr:CrcB family protein [Conchiformibius sp.]